MLPVTQDIKRYIHQEKFCHTSLEVNNRIEGAADNVTGVLVRYTGT